MVAKVGGEVLVPWKRHGWCYLRKKAGAQTDTCRRRRGTTMRPHPIRTPTPTRARARTYTRTYGDAQSGQTEQQSGCRRVSRAENNKKCTTRRLCGSAWSFPDADMQMMDRCSSKQRSCMPVLRGNSVMQQNEAAEARKLLHEARTTPRQAVPQSEVPTLRRDGLVALGATREMPVPPVGTH